MALINDLGYCIKDYYGFVFNHFEPIECNRQRTPHPYSQIRQDGAMGS